LVILTIPRRENRRNDQVVSFQPLKMLEWEVGPTEMSERLHEAGIRGKSFKPRPLTSDLSRHRTESRKGKK
jgi:hypothetical protein